MVRFAYAKINWSLAVLGRRADGYHLLDMLMQTISLADTLTFAPAEKLTLALGGEVTVPQKNNLVLRAARLLQEACGVQMGAAIGLTKRIPAGAGLGGGSADAAATLQGLNDLWGLELSAPRLAELGARLGADVPFCLMGGLARVRGIGEQITPLPNPTPYHLVLIKPEQGLSTPAVFSAYDGQMAKAEQPSLDRLQAALLSGDMPVVQGSLFNALQPVAVSMLPDVQACLDALMEAGARAAVMTGSGSAVFGLFEDETAAQDAAMACRGVHRFAEAVQTLPRP